MKKLLLLLIFAFSVSYAAVAQTKQPLKRYNGPKYIKVENTKVLLPSYRSNKHLEYLKNRYKTPYVNTSSISCEYLYGSGNNYSNIFFFDVNYAFSTDPQSSLGVTFGQVKNIGYYISVMTGFNYTALNTGVECDKDGLIGDEMQYYSGQISNSRYSIIGGAMIRLFEPLALKVGGGYGARALAWGTGDGRWIRNSYYSYSGFELNAGLQFFMDAFNMSFDFISNSLTTAEFKIGLGININR